MIYSTLSIEELLKFSDRPEAVAEIIRQLKSAEIMTREQADDWACGAHSEAALNWRPDAVNFLITLIDGDTWRQHLTDDQRGWLKTDLGTFYDRDGEFIYEHPNAP